MDDLQVLVLHYTVIHLSLTKSQTHLKSWSVVWRYSYEILICWNAKDWNIVSRLLMAKAKLFFIWVMNFNSQAWDLFSQSTRCGLSVHISIHLSVYIYIFILKCLHFCHLECGTKLTDLLTGSINMNRQGHGTWLLVGTISHLEC